MGLTKVIAAIVAVMGTRSWGDNIAVILLWSNIK